MTLYTNSNELKFEFVLNAKWFLFRLNLTQIHSLEMVYKHAY